MKREFYFKIILIIGIAGILLAAFYVQLHPHTIKVEDAILQNYPFANPIVTTN